MSYEKIQISNIDNNLFSGSRDTLRYEFGLYHHVVTDTDGHTDIVKNQPDPKTWAGPVTFNNVDARETQQSNLLSYIQTNDSLNTTSSANIATKTKKMSCRLIGDSTKILSDEHWKAIVIGGTYGDTTHKNLFTDATFDDHSYDYNKPYNIVKAKELADSVNNLAAITSYANFINYEIGYDYNYHLKKYENYIKNLNNLLIPNINMMEMITTTTDALIDKEYDEYMVNFLTVEGTYTSSIDNLFKDLKTETPPPHVVQDYTLTSTVLYHDETSNIREYLNDFYASSSNTYSATTKEAITGISNTLYYNTNFSDTMFKNVNDHVHRMPMSAFVKFPTEAVYSSTSSLFYTDIIRDNDLEEDFLYFLKNNFPAANMTLNCVQKQRTFYGETETAAGNYNYVYKTNLSDNKKTCVNFLSALGSIYNSTTFSKDSSGFFMGPKTLNTVTTQNEDSKFRFFKRMKASQAIEQTISNMNNIVSKTDGYTDVRDVLLALQDTKRPAETIAYRLQKRGGSFLDSERKITTLQDCYFFNSDELRSDGPDFVYHDTQIKLGEQYSYTLYAYVIVPGYQYKYDNLRVSRTIGEVLEEREEGGLPGARDIVSDPENICIEFYNPATGEAAEQLLNTETNLIGNEYVTMDLRTNSEARDAWRVAWLVNDLKIQDCIPDYNPDLSIDSMAEETATNKYYQLFGYDSTAELMPNNPAPETTILDLFSNDPAYQSATGVASSMMTFVEMFRFDREAIDEYLTPLGALLEETLYKAWARKNLTYTYTTTHPDEPVEKTVTVAELASNRFATNAQIKSSNKYLADFNFTIAPSVKIIEVPVATKTLQIMDHPPVAPDVTPYQRKDDSQIIGFMVRTESFRVPTDPTDTSTLSDFGIYPTPITSDEINKREIYITSNNMIEGEQITKNSVSKPSILEVYRLDRKPTSISDFDGNLVFTKDLSIDSLPDQKNSVCFYEEKIRTNKKFYYLFRFLNENGDGGYLSPVQCAELINDGGYKYTKFDVMYESELYQENNRQDTQQFKKLLQITPSIDHLKLNDDSVDYAQPAASQLSSLTGKVGMPEKDLIWGKTFKFRITSKKTGKKIDLNIKYRLRDT